MSTAYFIHSVREDIYIYIYDGSTSLYICRYAVCAFYLFILLVMCFFFFVFYFQMKLLVQHQRL